MRGIKGNKKELFGDGFHYWINGKTIPDTANIIRICEILEISADWLLGISDKEPMWLFYRGNNMYKTGYGEMEEKI